MRWGPEPVPLSAAQGRLEADINRILSNAGVADADIVHHQRSQRRLFGFPWIEVHRTVETTAASRRTALAGLQRLERWPLVRVELSGEASAQPQLVLRSFGLPLQTLKFRDRPRPVRPAHAPPRAAIVIDDVGYNLDVMNGYAALGVPLTFAILPGDRRAPALSEKAHRLGFPVIVHLPLEPLDMVHNNPGMAGLFLKMNAADMKQQFDRDIARVPHAVGLNNHMGSAFTENEEAMTRLLGWTREKGLFFLDSRTSTRSVGITVARRLNVPCLANHTFLDNQDEPEAIETQLDKVMDLALKHGRTVAIGHYRRKHLRAAIEKKLPAFRAAGVELVGLPALVAALKP